MSQQVYRVVARDSAGNWYETMEGLRHECRAFVHKMSARRRKATSPVITRRTFAGWMEKVNERSHDPQV